jgi:hypothetical protein
MMYIAELCMWLEEIYTMFAVCVKKGKKEEGSFDLERLIREEEGEPV